VEPGVQLHDFDKLGEAIWYGQFLKFVRLDIEGWQDEPFLIGECNLYEAVTKQYETNLDLFKPCGPPFVMPKGAFDNQHFAFNYVPLSKIIAPIAFAPQVQSLNLPDEEPDGTGLFFALPLR
jgi:hypothetical protein